MTEPTTAPDPSILIPINAIRAFVRALHINTRAVEMKLGISLAQLHVLHRLAERPAESLNELADETATHQSSVSVVVQRLVARGLASRNVSPVDRRRIEIAITEEGRSLLRSAPPTLHINLIKSLRQMPVDDRLTLGRLMQRWMEDGGVPIGDVNAPSALLSDDDSPAPAD